jgi:phage baseplate assembly protein W
VGVDVVRPPGDRPVSTPIALSFPFQLSRSGKLATTQSYEEVVRAQVIDALMTNRGERVFRARYGCDVQAAVFDPSDELMRRDAGGQIKARLEQLVPRCIVRNVTVEIPNTGPRGVINITILYRPSVYSTDTTLTVPVASEFLNRVTQSLREVTSV